MAKIRSPNYPNIPLGVALEAVRPAFVREHRNKMSRLVLAKHLGYTSLNGRALGRIGAVRAYGLIDGSGDELRISDDAVPALAAPMGAPEKQAAMARLAARPTLFADIRKQFPETHPSPENLAFWLVTQGFTQKAAEKAAKSYLSTMSLVAGIPDPYNSGDDDEVGDGEGSESADKQRNPPPPPPPGSKVKIMERERVAFTEEGQPGQYLKLIASGDVDDTMLEALEDFVKRQRKRLALATKAEAAGDDE